MPEPQSPLTAALKGKPAPIKPVGCLSTQGHAGTVPMAVRRDPLAAAAEAISMIEQQCGGGQLPGMMQTMPHGKQAAQSVLDPSLVCTVGAISVWPGASNVIAGSTNFSVDIRQANVLPQNAKGAQLSSTYQPVCLFQNIRHFRVQSILCKIQLYVCQILVIYQSKYTCCVSTEPH